MTIVEVTQPRPGVALLTFAHPPRNQMSAKAAEEIHRHLDDLDRDSSVRCLILTGTNRSWCAGADLREEKESTESDLEAYVSKPDGFSALIDRLDKFRVPVIAAINGHAVGGGMELALACDIRVGSTFARFMCAGVNVGLILSWYRLPRTIGLGPAKRMLLTGEMVDAQWALRTGLITDLLEPDELLHHAIELATRIATRAPLSVEATKACANRAFELENSAAARLQQQQFIRLARSSDHQEAVASFFDRRPAVYRGQ